MDFLYSFLSAGSTSGRNTSQISKLSGQFMNKINSTTSPPGLPRFPASLYAHMRLQTNKPRRTSIKGIMKKIQTKVSIFISSDSFASRFLIISLLYINLRTKNQFYSELIQQNAPPLTIGSKSTKNTLGWAINSVEECYLHTVEVTGSNPVSPTINHPNIATIHGLEKSDDQQFLVMELVEGETLRDRLTRRIHDGL